MEVCKLNLQLAAQRMFRAREHAGHMPPVTEVRVPEGPGVRATVPVTAAGCCYLVLTECDRQWPRRPGPERILHCGNQVSSTRRCPSAWVGTLAEPARADSRLGGPLTVPGTH